MVRQNFHWERTLGRQTVLCSQLHSQLSSPSISWPYCCCEVSFGQIPQRSHAPTKAVRETKGEDGIASVVKEARKLLVASKHHGQPASWSVESPLSILYTADPWRRWCPERPPRTRCAATERAGSGGGEAAGHCPHREAIVRSGADPQWRFLTAGR